MEPVPIPKPELFRNPGYQRWAEKESWTQDEAILLIHGIMPPKEYLEADPKYFQYITEKEQLYGGYFDTRYLDDLKDPFNRLLDAGERRSLEETLSMSDRALATGELSGDSSGISPRQAVDWARSAGISVPDGLISCLEAED